jgi:hypothetical protein
MWHWHGFDGAGILGWLGMAVMMFLVFGGLIVLVGLHLGRGRRVAII